MSDIQDMEIEQKRAIFIKSLLQKQKAAGHNDASLARDAGLNPTAVRDIMKNQKNMPRYDTIEALANALKCSVEALVTGEDKLQQVETSSLIPAKIKGYVQAGNWGEAHEFLEEDQELIYVDAAYKDQNIYGLIVRGDSMDIEYKEGCVLHCVAFNPYSDQLRNGDHVIVNAICVADEVETTVKEYQIDEDGKEWLVPRSSKAQYQTPYAIPVKQDDNVFINGKRIKEISVTAIVVGYYYQRRTI